jgi:opacity protein-like surface antigen
MKKLILIAGAAMLAATAPAAADPGKGHGKGKSATTNHGKPHKAAKSAQGVVTSDRFGRLHALNARGTCPPGLGKKNNGCLPPGQAKKQYNVGQRYNRNFGTNWTYNQIPENLQSQYTFDRSDQYYYRNGYLYQVDPKTMLVQQVVSALLR